MIFEHKIFALISFFTSHIFRFSAHFISYFQLLSESLQATDLCTFCAYNPVLGNTPNPPLQAIKLLADLVLQILSYVAETERNNIKKRQAEGIAIARANGKFKKKDIDMTLYKKLRKEVEKGTMTVNEAYKQLGVSRQTWYNLKKVEK